MCQELWICSTNNVCPVVKSFRFSFRIYRVFMLILIKFWNCALIGADDVDECLKVVDSVN